MPRGRVAREWPLEDIRRWVEEEGRTHRWVAEQVGTTDQHISRLCRSAGIRVQRRGPRGGAGHPDWRGGRIVDKHGYILVHNPDHPSANSGGYVREHRLVMEAALGRPLTRTEVVHHIDGNPANNSPENLEMFASNGDHLRHELAGRCPAWSPEGKARILEANRRRGGRRQAPSPALSEPGDPPSR